MLSLVTVDVHGLLGQHPDLDVNANQLPYGKILDVAALESAIDQIVGVDDVADGSPEFERAQKWMSESSMALS